MNLDWPDHIADIEAKRLIAELRAEIQALRTENVQLVLKTKLQAQQIALLEAQQPRKAIYLES